MATVKRFLIPVLAGCTTWFTLVGAGCNLFEPAEPEPPNAQALIPDYSDPDSTLKTIALALRDKARTNGAGVYIGAFADSTGPTTPAYHHFFWPSDVTDTGATLPEDWSILEESDFYIKFISLRDDEYRLIWELDVESGSDETIGPRTKLIHRHYKVITETADGDPTATIACGFAELTLVQGADENWRISIWRDRVDQNCDPGAEEVTLGRRRLKPQWAPTP